MDLDRDWPDPSSRAKVVRNTLSAVYSFVLSLDLKKRVDSFRRYVEVQNRRLSPNHRIGSSGDVRSALEKETPKSTEDEWVDCLEMTFGESPLVDEVVKTIEEARNLT